MVSRHRGWTHALRRGRPGGPGAGSARGPLRRDLPEIGNRGGGARPAARYARAAARPDDPPALPPTARSALAHRTARGPPVRVWPPRAPAPRRATVALAPGRRGRERAGRAA